MVAPVTGDDVQVRVEADHAPPFLQSSIFCESTHSMRQRDWSDWSKGQELTTAGHRHQRQSAQHSYQRCGCTLCKSVGRRADDTMRSRCSKGAQGAARPQGDRRTSSWYVQLHGPKPYQLTDEPKASRSSIMPSRYSHLFSFFCSEHHAAN